jgi:DNA-binding CsgD family transcriptional regulator
MPNLNHSNLAASRYQSKASAFSISNSASPIPQDTPFDMSDELHAALGRMGCAYILLKPGETIEANATGRAVLDRYCGFAATAKSLPVAAKEIVKRAGIDIPAGSMSWLATSIHEGRMTLVNQTTNVWSDETRAIILIELDSRPEPSARTLQRLFGMTAAETHLAIELARGGNLLDIARSQGLSRTTMRSHLASLFVKTQTRRQVELVSLLRRIALFP